MAASTPSPARRATCCGHLPREASWWRRRRSTDFRRWRRSSSNFSSTRTRSASAAGRRATSGTAPGPRLPTDWRSTRAPWRRTARPTRRASGACRTWRRRTRPRGRRGGSSARSTPCWGSTNLLQRAAGKGCRRPRQALRVAAGPQRSTKSGRRRACVRRTSGGSSRARSAWARATTRRLPTSSSPSFSRVSTARSTPSTRTRHRTGWASTPSRT
mmetsp:Transcript_33540/g.91860  ORF Transcript_33540/g.91860 Transcript_33540/m.91860 type:complete len:215 (+) Transcript_33540:277-921(+)